MSGRLGGLDSVFSLKSGRDTFAPKILGGLDSSLRYGTGRAPPLVGNPIRGQSSPPGGGPGGGARPGRINFKGGHVVGWGGGEFGFPRGGDDAIVN